MSLPLLTDLTGRHTDITVYGAPEAVSDGAYFDGASCVLVNDGLSDFAPGTGSFTVEVDVNITGSAYNAAIVDFIGGLWGWAIQADGPYNLYFVRAPRGGNLSPVDATFGNPIGSWCKLAVSFDSGTGLTRLFLDGALVRTLTEPANFTQYAPRLCIGADGRTPEPVLFFLGKIRNVRITKAARYTAAYTPVTTFPTGTADPFWASTTLLLPLMETEAPSGYSVTSLDNAAATASGFASYAPSGPRTISGTLSAPFPTGATLQISFDGGATWTPVTISGLSWSFLDASDRLADWEFQLRSQTASGLLGPVVAVDVAQRTWPVASPSRMEKDTDVIGDWITSDGSAPRQVFGDLSRALYPEETLQVSFDGVNWLLASTIGTAWSAVDAQFHTSSWSIQTKTGIPGTLLESPIRAVQVTLAPPQPTVLPQGTYTTLLDIIRRFMERTGLPKPAFSIGNTDTQVAQILGLLEEATEEIVMRNARGWQILNRQAIFQTKAQEVQGSLSELAPGFRAIINDTLFNRTTRLPIYGPLLPMERQATKALQTAGPYYRYWIANDELHFYPIPPAGQTIAFEYTSTAAWSDGKTPTTYSEYPDSDTAICLFPKPVMIAQLRWRWKKEKGLEYAEDFAMAERLLNAAIAADGTRRVVDLGGTELVARPGIMIPTGSWPLK